MASACANIQGFKWQSGMTKTFMAFLSPLFGVHYLDYMRFALDVENHVLENHCAAAMALCCRAKLSYAK